MFPYSLISRNSNPAASQGRTLSSASYLSNIALHVRVQIRCGRGVVWCAAMMTGSTRCAAWSVLPGLGGSLRVESLTQVGMVALCVQVEDIPPETPLSALMRICNAPLDRPPDLVNTRNPPLDCLLDLQPLPLLPLVRHDPTIGVLHLSAGAMQVVIRSITSP